MRPFPSVPTLLAGFVLSFASACAPQEEEPRLTSQPSPQHTEEKVGEGVEVPPPPFTAGIFPCSNCHGMMPVDRNRRDLTAFHTEIELRHDEENRWCLDCHDATDRDWLHLANGDLVSFDES